MDQEAPKRIHESVTREMERIRSLCPSNQDPVLTILRCHLLTECYLERIIQLRLNRGDKVIDQANLSFKQKVVLVDGMDILPDRVIQSLKNLNAVRNSLAHEMEKTMVLSDVERIGRPFGKDFAKIKVKHGDDIRAFLSAALNILFRDINGHIYLLEEQTIDSDEKKIEDLSLLRE